MEFPKIMFFFSFLLSFSFVEGNLVDYSDLVDCPLCADPSHEPQSYGTFYANGANGNVISCEMAFNMTLRLPSENCTIWQTYGEKFCKCGAEPPAGSDCTLCQGGKLPQPLQAAPWSPETTCAQLQIKAKRDFPEHCPIWQQTMGIYCGCENRINTDTCQICSKKGSDLIPSKVIEGLDDGTTATCGEVEFQANFPDSGLDCQSYQTLFDGHCCEDPSESDDDSATIISSNMASFACIAGVIVMTALTFP